MSDDVDLRTPITLSPGGSADAPSEMDGVDVPVPGTPPGEEFWEDWLAEIAESEKAEFEAQSCTQGAAPESKHLLALEDWLEVVGRSEGPDPRYHLEAYDLGLDYADWLDSTWPTEHPMTESASQRERLRSQQLH